jgi:hypothetical protein
MIFAYPTVFAMAQPTIVLPEGSVDTSVPYTTSPKLTVTKLYGLVMERRTLHKYMHWPSGQ